MPKLQTFGWCATRDLTNQCGKCNWILIQHGMSCCEFDQPEFPHAQHCAKFEEAENDHA